MEVLIADDSKEVRDRLTSLLTEIPGLRVVAQAHDVASTKELVQQLEPDAVVLDIRMPDGSGIEALKFIKETKSTTIVIVFTNYPLESYRRQCVHAGAEFFLDKSSQFEEVAAILAARTDINQRQTMGRKN